MVNVDKFKELFLEILEENNQEGLKFTKSKIKEQYSVRTFSTLLVYIDLSLKSLNRIIIRGDSKIEELIPASITYRTKLSSSENIEEKDIQVQMYEYFFEFEKDDNKVFQILRNLKEPINVIAEFLIENHAPETVFDCCSHYMECSDAKRCTQYEKDPKLYRGCTYKEKLEKGIIFFGKNRNID